MQIKDGLLRHNDTAMPLNQISSTNINTETVQRRFDWEDPEERKIIEELIKKGDRKEIILIILSCFIIIGFLLLILWVIGTLLSRKENPGERYNSAEWDKIENLDGWTKFEDRHYLEIQMSSGSKSLFWSTDIDFVRKVNEIILEALSSSNSKAINYNINIEKQEVIDNSVNHVIQNFNYEIDASQHHGMTPEDLQFFSGELADSIKELGEQINSTGNQELQSLLHDLVETMNSKEAEPSTIHSTFEKLKKTAEAYDVYESVCGLFGVVSKAAAAIAIA